MKILGIGNSMSSSGAPRALVRVLSNLQLRGHQVSAAFLYRKADMPAAPFAVEVIVNAARPSVAQYATMPSKLFGLMRRERPDAVLGFLPLGSALGLSLAMLCGIKSRVASHRVPAETFGRAMRLADRWAGSVGIYTEIICVSQAVADSFATYPEGYCRRLKVVHNGLDFRLSERTREDARATFGIGPKTFLLAAAGRLTEQKNYSVLLEGLEGIAGTKCIIAGDGVLRGDIEAKMRSLGLGDTVELVGNLTSDRIADLLAAADAFVQPSRFEGQSNALLEAMTQGLPSIVSDIPEQIETVLDPNSDRAAAIVCGVEDAPAWHAAILELRESHDLRVRLGQNAKAIVADRFTLKRMIDGFEASLVRSGQD